MIRSFKGSETEALFAGRFSRRLGGGARGPEEAAAAARARELRDLAAFPGNRLEALAGDGAASTASGSTIRFSHLLRLEGWAMRGGRGDR